MTETFVPVAAKPGKDTAKKFKHEVRLKHLPERPIAELPRGEFRIGIEFHFHQYTTGDIDNLLKPTLDVIKGALIRDDRQIRELGAVIREHSDRNGVLIKLTPLIPGMGASHLSHTFEATVDTFKDTPVPLKTGRRRKKRRKTRKASWWQIWR